MKQRIEYFDFLRGIAILFVVAIHTFSMSTVTDYTIAIRQLLNIAVPLFLAISGYFLAKKEVTSTSAYFSFLKKQLPRVYIPCLLWSLPLFGFSLISGGSIIKNVLMLFVCGYSIYYFIALIMQYYMMLPLIQRTVNNVAGGGKNWADIRDINPIYNLSVADKRNGVTFDSLCRY